MTRPLQLLLVLVLSLGMVSPARADCPWQGKVTSVTASMTTVTVNGHLFLVKGNIARAQFAAVLSQCGANSMATQAFLDWRSMRRATNITGVIGGCVFFPALVGTAATAFLAGDKRDMMLAALLAPG